MSAMTDLSTTRLDSLDLDAIAKHCGMEVVIERYGSSEHVCPPENDSQDGPPIMFKHIGYAYHQKIKLLPGCNGIECLHTGTVCFQHDCNKLVLHVINDIVVGFTTANKTFDDKHPEVAPHGHKMVVVDFRLIHYNAEEGHGIEDPNVGEDAEEDAQAEAETISAVMIQSQSNQPPPAEAGPTN